MKKETLVLFGGGSDCLIFYSNIYLFAIKKMEHRLHLSYCDEKKFLLRLYVPPTRTSVSWTSIIIAIFFALAELKSYLRFSILKFVVSKTPGTRAINQMR